MIIVHRVFHVPAHLSYAAKLVGSTFCPVASPTGSPLRVGDLLKLPSWGFFDILHLHTVELASLHEIAALSTRLRTQGKGLVFTLHDLTPNIENDHFSFSEKTQLVMREAVRVVTLTHAAAEKANDRFGRRPAVLYHGFSVHPNHTSSARARPIDDGFLVFGALRPNRDVVAVARAWQRLAPPRPALRVVLRSVGAADRERYAGVLAELDTIAEEQPGLELRVTSGILPINDLVSLGRQATVLVMPYRQITHSGQLELARDLGLAVLAPDVPTVRAQLSETTHREYPGIWFPVDELDDPRGFAILLDQSRQISRDSIPHWEEFPQYRIDEHAYLINQYATEYRTSCNHR